MSWTTIELIEEGVEVALGDHIIPVEGISSIHPIVVGMGNASWAGERFTGAVVTEGTSVVLPSSYPQHYVFLLQHADNTWHAYTVTPEAGSATFTHDPAWLTEHTLTYPPAVDTVTPARTLFVLNDGHGLTSTTEPDTLIDQLWVLYSISSVVTPHRVADRPTVDDLDDVTTAGILDGEGLIWSTADNKFIPGPLGGGGVGNVTGPSSAEDNNIAVFDGTTGNIIKDGGYTIAELLAQHQVSVAYFVVDATWMTSASWVYTSGVGINLTGTPVTADLIGSYIVVVVDLVTYRCESYEITSTTAATYDQSYLEDRANDEDVVTTTKALQLSKMIYAVYDYVNAADMVDDVRLGSLYWVGYETGSSGHVRIVPVARDDYDFDDIIPTPLTDYIPKSLIDAKGDLIAGTAADTAARLPVGTDGQVLTANSTKSTGLEWVTLADLIVIPVTFVISQLEGPDELPLEAGLFATFRAPYAFTITDIRASLTTASSSGAVEWDVKKNATSVFSTTLTVDASEESSVTAATPAVISTTAIAADDEITVHVVDEGTDVEGGKVYITGMRLALTATYDSEAFEDAVGAMAGTGLSYDDGAGTISADLSSLIPKSIIDAKGDVIVGTAADTAARLAVGADGQVLTADSAEASGVKWAAAGGGGGAVDSVNGQTGVVVLDAGDVGALDASSGYNTANGWLKLDGSGTAPDSTLPSSIARDSEVSSAISTHAGATDPHGDRAYAAGLVDDLSGVTNASAARSNLGLGNVASRPQVDAARWSYGVPLGAPASASAAYNADQIMAFWFELEPRPIDALGLAVITNIASSYVRMGLYLPDDTGGKPGTLMVAHAGTVTTASTGHQSAAVSYTPSVLGCWAVVQVGGANGAASRSISYVNRRNLGGAAGDVTDACQLRVGRADAALPSSLAGTSWTYQSDTPHGMKVSYA